MPSPISSSSSEVTDLVFEILFDSRRIRSSMLRKSVLPPTFSWTSGRVDAPLTKDAEHAVDDRWADLRLMSSPMIGMPGLVGALRPVVLTGDGDGMQLTAHAASACSTYHLAASSLPNCK